MILIRNPNEPVAYHLLDCLARRDIDTKRQEEDVRGKAMRLRLEIAPITQDLYRERVSLHCAQDRLAKILEREEHAGPSLRAWATCSPRFGQDPPERPKKPPEAYTTVVENMRASFTKAFEAIRKRFEAISAADAIRTIQNLDRCIKREPHIVRFDAIESDVRWTVEVKSPPHADRS